MFRKALLFFFKYIFPIGLGLYLCVYFFAGMSDKSKKLFLQTIQDVDYFWIVLSLIVGLASYYSRAHRWKYALEPLGYISSIQNRFYAVMIGYLVNLTIPRAGEASRAVMLNRSEGVPFTIGFGTIISERIVDIIILLFITIVTFVIGREDFVQIKGIIENYFGPKEETSSLYIWIAVFFILISIFLLYFFKSLKEKIFTVMKSLFQSAFSIFKTQNPMGYILHSLFIWICFLVMFALPFYSLESTRNLPVTCVLLAFIAGSVGISLTNGGLGSYPLLVGLVIAYYLKDLPNEEAFAIGNALGLIIWASQTALLIIIGLISWVLIPKKI